MHQAHFTRIFAAAHRVWNDGGKCSNIHGHNYTVEIDIASDALTAEGFILPFDGIKRAIDTYDHTLIIDMNDPLRPDLSKLGIALSLVEGPPSTERMAEIIATRILDEWGFTNMFAKHAEVLVEVRETAGIAAQWEDVRDR